VTKIVASLTPHGYWQGTFADMRHQTCTMRESAGAKAGLWFGLDGQAQMMLDRETVASLLPYLHTFVDIGLLSDPTRDVDYPDAKKE
jgi:hypothetical protein